MFTAQHYSLAKLNAFRFDHVAEIYVECQSHDELLEIVRNTMSSSTDESAPIVIGDGSNTLLTRDLTTPVLRYTGTALTLEPCPGESAVLVTAQAGKNWHELVVEMTEQGLHGIENLSLIPGTCGAAPVQNIGAYGVELSDTLTSVTALHWPTRKLQVLTLDECQFAYRDSVFKRKHGTYIITEISLKLRTHAKLVTSYGAIQEMLDKRQLTNPTAKDISDIVCEIRRSKLPDPDTLPNAGSFFKNPVISTSAYESLIKRYPDLPSYPAGSNTVKIAAGWLIDKAGLKGYRHHCGHVGVHDRQALVLVHHGGGNSAELMELAQHVQDTVLEQFDIVLEREPVLR